MTAVGCNRAQSGEKDRKGMGVAVAPKKKYLLPMNNFKNLLIAILTGLLVLSLFTQPAQSAAKSKEAKAMEYGACINYRITIYQYDLDAAITGCAKYRP